MTTRPIHAKPQSRSKRASRAVASRLSRPVALLSSHCGRVHRGWVVVAVGMLAFFVANGIDRWSFHLLLAAHPHRLGTRDWYGLFKSMGSPLIWLAIAAALWLHDLVSRGRRHPGESRTTRLGLASVRAGLLLVTLLLAGVLGDFMKLVARRERPMLHDGIHVFRSWAVDTFSTSDLGLPSSHAISAFAAAFMMSRFFPASAPVLLAMAAGCAASRLLVGAHFLSDVVLAAVLSYALTSWLWREATARPRLAGGLPAYALPPRDVPADSTSV